MRANGTDAVSGTGPEVGLRPLLIGTLVLLTVIGVVLWFAASAPYGNSVIVTIRNP